MNVFPAESRRKELEEVADHWNLPLTTLLETIGARDASGAWYLIQELWDYVTQEQVPTPTRRRIILYYASRMKENPFTPKELFARMPVSQLPEGLTCWYNHKKIAHALGFGINEEQEWYHVSRLSVGKEDKWFVARRVDSFAPLLLAQLLRLYNVESDDLSAILAGRVLTDQRYTIVHLLHDCITARRNLDVNAVFSHLDYFYAGLNRTERLQAQLIDFMGMFYTDQFCFAENLRRGMNEREFGSPYIYLSQEALGMRLKQALQTQESRRTLSNNFILDRRREGAGWAWRVSLK